MTRMTRLPSLPRLGRPRPSQRIGMTQTGVGQLSSAWKVNFRIMSDYSSDLWDRYKEVQKRFDNGMSGTSSVAKMCDVISALHKTNGKALSKIKLKTEDYGGMGESMKQITQFFTVINSEEVALATELKTVKDEIAGKNKLLKKEISKHHKEEQKAVKLWQQAKSKVASCKKKDLSDSLKWTKARQNLIESEQAVEPNEKKIEKNVKNEKKLRAVSIKSRDGFEKAVEELELKDKEYHEKIREILGEVEQVDVRFLERQKESLVQFAELLQKFYQNVLEETQKLKEEMEKIDPEEFVANFVEATKTGKVPPEPESFEPWIKDKAQYTEDRPARRIPAEGGGGGIVTTHAPSGGSGGGKNRREVPTGSVTGKVVEVTFDYSPEGNLEEGDDPSQYLELKQGDRIEVIQENKEGWWYGKLDGKEGYFPMNYVKEVEADAPPAPVEEPTEEEQPPPAEPEPEAEAPQGREKPAEGEYEVIEVVTSQADYDAQTDSELTMGEGDSINVFVKNDDGWWYGEIGGRRGYFPYNFTSAYTEE